MSDRSSCNYAIISPVRNEQDHIRRTLDSVVSQTILPLRWVIVDDGSTDRTTAIVSEYAEIYPWIQLVRRKNHGNVEGLVQAEEAKAFLVGLGYVDLVAIGFVGKLDGDLVLGSDYFEQLLNRAAEDARLGIISGVTYFMYRGRRSIENTPTHHTIGAARLWRAACFREIGGLVPALGWDTLDEVRARMRGWKTRSYTELQILHLRPMSSKGSWYKGRMVQGLTDYLLGNHPLFELARCLYRMTRPPYFVGGLFILLGYMRAALRVERQIVTAEERRFLQKHQLRRLLKLRTTYSGMQ